MEDDLFLAYPLLGKGIAVFLALVTFTYFLKNIFGFIRGKYFGGVGGWPFYYSGFGARSFGIFLVLGSGFLSLVGVSSIGATFEASIRYYVYALLGITTIVLAYKWQRWEEKKIKTGQFQSRQEWLKKVKKMNNKYYAWWPLDKLFPRIFGKKKK